jgi:hypothetical protein
VSPYVELVLAILLPTAVGYGIISGIRAVRWAAQRRAAAQFHSHATVEPIERLAARLRRLRAELEAVETGVDLPAKQMRLRALRGAYLDSLAAACERLDASPPPRGDRVPQVEIYRAEAALRERGLDVRRASPS